MSPKRIYFPPHQSPSQRPTARPPPGYPPPATAPKLRTCPVCIGTLRVIRQGHGSEVFMGAECHWCHAGSMSEVAHEYWRSRGSPTGGLAEDLNPSRK